MRGIDCGGTERPPPLLFNATSCDCLACDDIINISISVVAGVPRRAVTSALVFSVDGRGHSQSLLGTTGPGGRFSYGVPVQKSSMALVLRVIAVGYKRQDTSSISLLPAQDIFREVVLTEETFA